MSLIVRALEALGGEVRVHLSRGEVGMAKEFLDTAEIGAGVEHVRGVTVAEFVGREMGIETSQSEIFF